MSDERVYLKVGDLFSARLLEMIASRKSVYDTAWDALELIGVDPTLRESELRERLGTTDD